MPELLTGAIRQQAHRSESPGHISTMLSHINSSWHYKLAIYAIEYLKSASNGTQTMSTHGVQERWLDAEAEKARRLPGTSSAHHTADPKACSLR